MIKNIKCKECESIVKPNDTNIVIYEDYVGFVCTCGNTILDYEIGENIINNIFFK